MPRPGALESQGMTFEEILQEQILLGADATLRFSQALLDLMYSFFQSFSFEPNKLAVG